MALVLRVSFFKGQLDAAHPLPALQLAATVARVRCLDLVAVRALSDCRVLRPIDTLNRLVHPDIEQDYQHESAEDGSNYRREQHFVGGTVILAGFHHGLFTVEAFVAE